MPKSEVEVVLGDEMMDIFNEFGLPEEKRVEVREFLREWDDLICDNPQKIKIVLQKLEELKCSSEENKKVIEVLLHITHAYAMKKHKPCILYN